MLLCYYIVGPKSKHFLEQSLFFYKENFYWNEQGTSGSPFLIDQNKGDFKGNDKLQQKSIMTLLELMTLLF